MSDAIQNIQTRATVRDFTGQHVPREQIKMIAEAGRHAPTGCNTQTRRLTVVTSTNRIAELCTAMGKYMAREEPYVMYHPSAIIIVSEDSNDANALSNCAVAMENMLLAAHALGVGAVWINQLIDFQDNAEVRVILDQFQIPATHKAFFNVALGMPAAPVQQRSKEDMPIDWID